MPLLSANIIICETVLFEKTEVPSAIRIMNSLALAEGTDAARFFVITFLACEPGDFSRHVLKIAVTQQHGAVIAETADYPFQYGYRIRPSDPGGFILTTEFNIDGKPLGLPLGCLVSAYLDGEAVARATLTLRRG